VSDLRSKGQAFVARARACDDPGRRAGLLRAARVTLHQARRRDAARYAAGVGRAQVTLSGYRAWQARRLRAA